MLNLTHNFYSKYNLQSTDTTVHFYTTHIIISLSPAFLNYYSYLCKGTPKYKCIIFIYDFLKNDTITTQKLKKIFSINYYLAVETKNCLFILLGLQLGTCISATCHMPEACK